MDKQTVMLVDDSTTNNILYESILTDEGFEVITCTDAKSALKRLQKDIPDLIMLDLMMPGMDGLDFMLRLKENPEIPPIPIIMLTASNDKASEAKALSLGVAAYLNKPVGILQISEKVKDILSAKVRS